MNLLFQLKAEVDKYLQQKSQIEKERDEALRLVSKLFCVAPIYLCIYI